MPERVLRLVNLLSCSVARLPSLRECRGEIAMLASLYIAKKNVEFSKQILGFEPGAVELMQEYQWPYNYTQLKRVLDELTAVTPTSYISRRDIAHCLEKERQLFGGAGEGEAFDFEPAPCMRSTGISSAASCRWPMATRRRPPAGWGSAGLPSGGI